MPLLNDIARLPVPTDNCAIAIRDLDAGTVVSHDGAEFSLSHTILEGHRFAIEPIAKGEQLLSWGQSFGFTLRDIQPGEYMMNNGVKTELSRRNLNFELPAEPNFDNEDAKYTFDAGAFQPIAPIELYPDTRTFMGYGREGGRGVGTPITHKCTGIRI